MGEPLANFDNVVPALQLMLDDNAYGLSRRRVTLSTSGLVPLIDRLRDECPVALAVSLHAPNDALRDRLVPINRKHPLAELLAACVRYLARRAARLRDLRVRDARRRQRQRRSTRRELVALVRDVPCKFNLIPFNPFPGTEFRRARARASSRSRSALQDAGLVTTIRKTRGDDIDAACGQLAGQVQDRTKRRLATRIVPVHCAASPRVRPRGRRRMNAIVHAPIARPLSLPSRARVLAGCESTSTTKQRRSRRRPQPDAAAADPGSARAVSRAAARRDRGGLLRARADGRRARGARGGRQARSEEREDLQRLRARLHDDRARTRRRSRTSSARSSSRRTIRRSARTGAGTCARTAAPRSRSPSSRSRVRNPLYKTPEIALDQRRQVLRCEIGDNTARRGVLPARAVAQPATAPRRRTTSRCWPTAQARLDEARALMRRVMQQPAPAAGRALPRHVHRAQARRPRRPRRRTCRSCATAIRTPPRPRPFRRGFASERQRERRVRRASDRTTPSRDAAPSAGARLRAAREAAGLSIDAVAQQLKLAPRQVRALEDDDFAQLPGRTFVRGFMRNYARLVAARSRRACWRRCPTRAATPSLDQPSLVSRRRASMGELPGRPARQAEGRALGDSARAGRDRRDRRRLRVRAAAGRARARRRSRQRNAGRPSTRRDARRAGAAAAPHAAARPAKPRPAPRPSSRAAPTSRPPAGAAASADATLVFVFRGTSWIEVKDARATVVLSTIGLPGATHARRRRRAARGRARQRRGGRRDVARRAVRHRRPTSSRTSPSSPSSTRRQAVA